MRRSCRLRPSPALALLFLAVGCTQTDDATEEPEGPTWVSGPAIAVEARPTGSVYLLAEDPLPVSGCYSGGDSSGRTLAYAEQAVDLRERAFGFTAYDPELADLLALSQYPTELDIDVAATFGVDPAGVASSADDPSLRATTGFVSPGAFGVFYRQTLEVRRPANIVALTEVGDEYVIGELVLTDWDFRGDMGTGSSCPPFPPAPRSLTGE